MSEPRLVLRCYHVDGSFSDVFIKDCNFDREPFPDCIEIECMSLEEWFEEDCEATDFSDEEEECLDALDEHGVYKYD